MRKTKVLQILSLAASVATPSLAFAGKPQSSFTLQADGVSVLRDADNAPGSFAAVNAMAPATFSGQVPQVNNHPFWALLGDGSWSVANNWSTGVVPNAASDSARWVNLVVHNNGRNTSLDGSFTVGTVGFHSHYQHNIIPPTTAAQTTLTIANAGVNVVSDDAPNGNFNTIVLGNAIRTNIAGTNGITKGGAAGLQLSAASSAPGNAIASTFTGGVNVNSGILSISEDGSLGDASNNVTFGGTGAGMLLSSTIAGGQSTFRNFTLNGTNSFILFNDYTIAGVVSGTGDLKKARNTANILTLVNANNYSGATIIADAGAVRLNDGGRITNTSRVDIGGVLSLNQAGSNNDRVNNAAPINMYGGTLVTFGKNTPTGPNETLGNLSIHSGVNRLLVNDSAVAGNRAQLHFGTVTRNNRSGLFVRGNNLGTGAAGGGSITFTAAPAMIGGNGAAGTTNISVIPWISGNNNPALTGDFNGVVTYDATNGLRPLALTEYVGTLGTQAATDNVRLTAVGTINTAQTMNSLVLAGAGAASIGGGVQGTGQLTITSGQIVFADISTDPLGDVIANPVHSPNEIILWNTAASGQITGVISNTGGGGLTSAEGTTFVSNTANTYTGPTSINHSFLVATGNLPNNAPSALGVSDTPIFIRPGANSNTNATGGTAGSIVAGLLVQNAVPATGAVVDRPIQIDNDPLFTSSGTADVGTNNADGDGAVTWNGNIAINGSGIMRLNSQAPTAGATGLNDPNASGMIFNGVISGTGRINDVAVTVAAGTQNPLVNRFNGQNTYDSTTILTNVFQLGSSSVGPGGAPTSGPLGVGTIHWASAQGATATTGAIQAMGAPRTLANNMRYRNTPNFIGSQDITLTGFQDLGSAIRAINVTNTAETTISGVVGRGGIVKRGSGRLTLTGNNTFLSQTQIEAGGALRIGSNNALGGALNTFVTSEGATFLLGAGVLEVFNNINSPEQLFIGAAGTPAIAVATGNIRNTTGSNTLSGIIGLGAPGTANVGVDAGSTLSMTGTFAANAGTLSGAQLSKVGAGPLNVRSLSVSTATLTTGTGTLAVAVNNGTVKVLDNGTDASLSRVSTLSISPTGFVDLRDNDMILRATPKSVVEAYVAAGYNFGGYDGLGGMTTTKGAETGITTLGVLDGNEYFNNTGDPTFDGQITTGSDILVKYTYFGDVDFNGQVDVSDYNLIDFGFNSGLSGWANGDVDWSGSVDVSDYNLIDVAFASQSGTLRRAVQYLDGSDRSTNGMSDPSLQKVAEHFEQFGESYAAGFLANVPEPTSLGIIGLAAGALMGRRRRRAAK